MINDFTQSFALEYAGARTKFRATASDLGGVLSEYRHPTATGPDGQGLFIDVARLGDVGAPLQLVVVSGTHGLEGLSGSAARIGWIKSGFAHGLPSNVSVLLVHALNPFGFAHNTRTTENNVDLNRNLFPLGTNFGGSQREWSNLALETIVADHLGAAERIGFIDWHTGIGGWSESFFLCFNDEGGPLHDEAVRWWGRDRIIGQKPHSLARPNYQGQVFHGLTKFLAGRPMVGAVIEFGTRGINVHRALQLDLWLKFKAEKDSERVRLLKADLQDCFVPVSSHWRESTTGQAISITQQAVEGLASWSLAVAA
ncbi:DUF2817 domain-containing protein [Bradyrhizobium sp. 200]|uniref:DUF2817 domain-containing protein n=1 Tax=Bradyrhizobium sp. 200 TaxID=2782665 RepID=UPI001FFE57B7|nr:DUF2817 domain-containing protein [Bradyrhizobium sp. 200]UPJ52731.1 DUF2817 domain-containing protein [Bradyrhizobium sp. 200]